MENEKAGHLRTNIASHQPCRIAKKKKLSKRITLIKENVPCTSPPEEKTNQLTQTASWAAWQLLN